MSSASPVDLWGGVESEQICLPWAWNFNCLLTNLQGHVVWEGTVKEFDSTEEPIVRQFASGSLDGPIKYE